MVCEMLSHHHQFKRLAKVTDCEERTVEAYVQVARVRTFTIASSIQRDHTRMHECKYRRLSSTCTCTYIMQELSRKVSNIKCEYVMKMPRDHYFTVTSLARMHSKRLEWMGGWVFWLRVPFAIVSMLRHYIALAKVTFTLVGAMYLSLRPTGVRIATVSMCYLLVGPSSFEWA